VSKEQRSDDEEDEEDLNLNPERQYKSLGIRKIKTHPTTIP
jgi:hypothetical protein